MVIVKEIINASLIRFYPVVVLRDDVTDSEVIVDGPDYSFFRMNEGMNDQEIMRFAGVV
jgi:hypothetical protein